jgi:hypothetical protein
MTGAPLPYPEEEEAAGDPASLIREMLALADEYRMAEQDDEDLLAMEKARTLLQQLLAAQQKQQDELVQGKASPAALRRFA